MLITCTNCATSYQVAAASLGPTGRSVRCARCKQMWFAANTEALADVADAHRADLAVIAEAPPVPDSPAPEQHFVPDPGVSPEPGPADQAFGSDAGMSPPGWPPLEDSTQNQHQDHPHQDHQRDDHNQDTSPPPIIDAPPLAPSEHTPTAPEDIESVAAR